MYMVMEARLGEETSRHLLTLVRKGLTMRYDVRYSGTELEIIGPGGIATLDGVEIISAETTSQREVVGKMADLISEFDPNWADHIRYALGSGVTGFEFDLRNNVEARIAEILPAHWTIGTDEGDGALVVMRFDLDHYLDNIFSLDDLEDWLLEQPNDGRDFLIDMCKCPVARFLQDRFGLDASVTLQGIGVADDPKRPACRTYYLLPGWLRAFLFALDTHMVAEVGPRFGKFAALSFIQNYGMEEADV